MKRYKSHKTIGSLKCHHPFFGQKLKDCCKPHPPCQHHKDCCKLDSHCYCYQKSCCKLHQPCFCKHHQQKCCNHYCYCRTEGPQQKDLLQVQPSQTSQRHLQRPQSVQDFKQPSLEQKFMNLLKKRNRQYFQEKGKLCCKKLPMKTKFDLLGTIPNYTTYKIDYNKKPLPQKGPHTNINKWPAHKGDFPTMPYTQYMQQYPEHPVQAKKRIPQKKKQQQAPFVGLSNYKTNYPDWGYAKQEPMKLPDTNDYVSGLPLNGTTIYKKDYTPKQGKILGSMKPMSKTSMTGFDFPKQTTNKDHFRKWDPYGTSSMKPSDKYDPKSSFPGQYGTQYKTEYLPKHGSQLNKCRYKLIDGFQEVMNS